MYKCTLTLRSYFETPGTNAIYIVLCQCHGYNISIINISYLFLLLIYISMLLHAAKYQTAMGYSSVYMIVIDILPIIGFDKVCCASALFLCCQTTF